MFWNNLAHGIQYLRRNPLFSLINVAGLVIGITSALFIFIHVRFELSFDCFHHDYENIYRVVGIDEALGVTSNNVGITMPPLGPAMVERFPEVEKAVRYLARGESLVSYNDLNLYIDSYAATDNVFFDVFDYPLLARQGEELLDQPNVAVITQSFARRLFGDEDPLGKVFRMNNATDLKVVAIAQDPPPNSHLQFELLLSLLTPNPGDTTGEGVQRFLNNWGVIAMVTYVKLLPGSDESQVEAKLLDLIHERSVMKTFSATLQPLSEVHLHSADILFDDYNIDKGDFQNVIMLSSVAVFLLVIAAFNFMNLSTARSSLRAKEVGLRKTYGATRPQLMIQFMQESLLLVALSAIIALGVMKLLEPVVSLDLAGGFLANLFGNPATLFIAVGLLLILAANVAAWSVAWYVMNNWLSGFAYRADMAALPFVVTAIGTAFLALATIIGEVMKVARSNPADSLRDE